MRVTFKSLLGATLEYTYNNKAERDKWFEKMSRKNGDETLYEKSFIIRDGCLYISGLGTFTFESTQEAKETWFSYLSRKHDKITGY